MAGGAPVPVPFNPNNYANFSPYGTIALGVTSGGTASVSGTFTTNLSINANSYMVFNETTKTVYVASGYSANGPITAAPPTGTESNNSTPVGAGAILIFTKLGTQIANNNAGTQNLSGAFDTVAVYPGAAAGNVYFTAGDGA